VAVPIYATSTFAFEAPGKTKGYDYSRTANPTRSALEECLAALEGGAGATATATGMAAETSVMAFSRRAATSSRATTSTAAATGFSPRFCPRAG
jgi:cystathionine beta-lyase/cystathionine gamma-synthase